MIFAKRFDGLCFDPNEASRGVSTTKMSVRATVSRVCPELRQPLVDLRQQVGRA
jgi:hypothetical protein